MEISRWWSEAKPPEPARIRDSASARRWNFRDPPPPPLPGRSPFHPRRVRWLTPPANFHRPFGTDACSPAEWEARCRARSNLRRTRRTLGPDRSPCGDRAMPALQICDARSGRRTNRGEAARDFPENGISLVAMESCCAAKARSGGMPETNPGTGTFRPRRLGANAVPGVLLDRLLAGFLGADSHRLLHR